MGWRPSELDGWERSSESVRFGKKTSSLAFFFTEGPGDVEDVE